MVAAQPARLDDPSTSLALVAPLGTAITMSDIMGSHTGPPVVPPALEVDAITFGRTDAVKCTDSDTAWPPELYKSFLDGTGLFEGQGKRTKDPV